MDDVPGSRFDSPRTTMEPLPTTAVSRLGTWEDPPPVTSSRDRAKRFQKTGEFPESFPIGCGAAPTLWAWAPLRAASMLAASGASELTAERRAAVGRGSGDRRASKELCVSCLTVLKYRVWGVCEVLRVEGQRVANGSYGSTKTIDCFGLPGKAANPEVRHGSKPGANDHRGGRETGPLRKAFLEN